MNRDELVKNYKDRFLRHGPSPEAVQYSDRASQYARFEVLAEVSSQLKSVLDVGCGLADFCHYLRSKGLPTRYTGIDIVPEFVDYARQSLAIDEAADVHLLDAMKNTLPMGHDWVIASGIFNNAIYNNETFFETTVKHMWSAAKEGIAFNAMSTWVEFQDPALWYLNPIDALKFVKDELRGHPILRHDYLTRPGGFPFEFVLYVYKTPQIGGFKR